MKLEYLEAFTTIFNRLQSSSDSTGSPPRWVKIQGECPYWASYASQVQSAVPVPVLTFSFAETAALVKSAFQRHVLRCQRNGCACGEIADEWREAVMELFSDTKVLSISGFLPSTDPDSPRCSVM